MTTWQDVRDPETGMTVRELRAERKTYDALMAADGPLTIGDLVVATQLVPDDLERAVSLLLDSGVCWREGHLVGAVL